MLDAKLHHAYAPPNMAIGAGVFAQNGKTFDTCMQANDTHKWVRLSCARGVMLNSVMRP